jgi:hypothetical protein
LALDFRAQTAYEPFFSPMFNWLRASADGRSVELSNSLTVYLASEKVNSRTDDDKTLILATRR